MDRDRTHGATPTPNHDAPLDGDAFDYDVVVVGAGVIGSAAALALANDGARCLLLEAAPDAIKRYAGEWMHPTVADLMDDLGVDRPQAALLNRAGDGFVVFPEDGSPPITLPYPDGRRGFCCAHYDLADSVRQQAAAHPLVTYLPFARVIDAHPDGHVRFSVAGSHADQAVRAALIVGAEGRSSVCRRALSADHNRDVVSYMAALCLSGDTPLPAEGFGHIFMGGPGLALAYRVSPNEVRISLDVPASLPALRRDRAQLWAAFSPALPPTLREPALAAVHDKSLRWTATFFQPRTQRGAGRLVLVGDAVGLCHPLCSAGVAVGLLDVALLRQALRDGDLARYRADGARETWVPELMSCAVYQLLGRPDAGASLRPTLYRAWRHDPGERDRTLNILMGHERRPSAFIRSFAHIGLDALSDSLRQRLRGDLPPDAPSPWAQLKRLDQWARWPLASALPPWAVARLRPNSTIHAPF